MGFEPTISTVTGWHVKPLHHGATNDDGTAPQDEFRQPLKSSNTSYIVSNLIPHIEDHPNSLIFFIK